MNVFNTNNRWVDTQRGEFKSDISERAKLSFSHIPEVLIFFFLFFYFFMSAAKRTPRKHARGLCNITGSDYII